jgi:hypothetical protein
MLLFFFCWFIGLMSAQCAIRWGRRKRGGEGGHEMSRGKKIPNCKNHLLVIWISSHRFRCLGWPDCSFLEKCKLSFQGIQSKLGCLYAVCLGPSLRIVLEIRVLASLPDFWPAEKVGFSTMSGFTSIRQK